MKNEREISMSEGHTRVQWAVAIIITTTVFTYGLQCGWVSPMTKILQSPESPVGRPLTNTEISLIAGVPSLAAMAGIILLSYVVDRFGRKCAILIMSGFQLITWIIKVCPSNPTSLIISRIMCGIGAGGCFHVVPMYVKELSQDNIRGTLGSTVALSQNVGILTMYAIGGYLDYYTVLYLVVGFPIFTIAMVFKIPESPAFLVKRGKLKEAAATIAYLRGLEEDNKRVQTEIDIIKKEDEYFKSIPNISFFNIFKEKAWRRGFIIMFIVMTMHGLNGSFSIINYASILLADSEVKMSTELQTLAVPVFMIFGTLMTMTCVDRLGRKVILGTAFFISALIFIGLGSSMVLRDHGWATPGWIPVLALLMVVTFYGAGVSPIPFIIISEMFNFQIRAKLMGCLSLLAWFISFIQLVSFTAITGSLGAHVSFYIFGCINVVGGATVLLFLPETGGKSVEQIETELRKEKKIEDKIYNS